MKWLYLILILFALGCQNIKLKSNQNLQTGLLSHPWHYRDSIANLIKPLQFNNNIFNITDFGAKADGVTLCTKPINNAIDACHNAGGGTVVVKNGIYLTGPVILKSNVNLYIDSTATLRFTTDKSQYLPVVHTRFEGMECMNYSPLVYAYKQNNIAITGKGILDGQGEAWWDWKGKWSGSVGINSTDTSRNIQKEDVQNLTQMVENNIPLEQRVFGEGHFLRPSFIQPYLCNNVLIEGITIVRSPMWLIHPVLCQNVSVRKIHAESLGPNNDGCDPECCNNVLIDSCYFNTGDDCIAIKSGRNNDGRRIGVASTNILVQNCIMAEGHGGVVMGSEISGNVAYVFAENCIMDSPNLDRAIRFKSNALRGGIIEHIYVRNIEIKQVRETILKIDLFYENGTGNNIPEVKNVMLENINSQKSNYAYWIKGITPNSVNGIYFKNCSFNNVTEPCFEENATNLSFDGVLVNGQPFNKQ